jgi:hypothetical protein
MKWRRLRKWAKWTCTLAAAVALGVAVLSRFYWCTWSTMCHSGEDLRYVFAARGVIRAGKLDEIRGIIAPSESGWFIQRSSGWSWGRWGDDPPGGSREDWRAGILWRATPGAWAVGVSVLYPVGLTLIPAALLWYRDRRPFGPGLCKKCGYDRRCLAADAKCPECGTVPAPAAN